MSLLSLRDSLLFSGITDEDLQKLSTCLNAREKDVERDLFVWRAGDPVHLVYYILSGSMHIIDEDFWGNRTIIETMHKDTLFGEAYVFASRENHLISVIAAQDSKILEINPKKLFETCPNGCESHTQLSRNALHIVSEKIIRLTEKVGHITQRTIRAKIMSYLSLCAHKEQSDSFCIPYSRQQLADYLCVDRSALSHELSKLQKQGLIQYHKNYFELLYGSNK